MDSYVIMCRSVTHAQRGLRLLENMGVRAYMLKVPQSLTAEGCGYGLKLRVKDPMIYVKEMKSAGLRTGRVFRLDGGEYVEVGL